MELGVLAATLSAVTVPWKAIHTRPPVDGMTPDSDNDTDNDTDTGIRIAGNGRAQPGVFTLPIAPVPSDPCDRVVRIMMLGFSTSGKSTFLAGMWHYFAYGDGDGIQFATDEHSARYLNSCCRELLRGKLPSQTLNTREWSFTVRARGLSSNLTDAFRLVYVDYDGKQLGRLFEDPDDDSAPAEGADSRVRQVIDEYDVIMGMLDGARIAEIMRDAPDPEYAVWLEQLFFLIAGQNDKPVHLVLTKYDLLDGRYTLGEIVEKLRGRYGPFDQFCSFPSIGRKRLIPVAALGTNGFVQAEADGSMRINTAMKWDSRSVERPLVCALPDVLETELAKVGRVAPGYRPTAQSRMLHWDNYSQALAWAVSIFAVDASIAKGPIDLSANATAAALIHLTKLLAQHESRIPGSRLSRWRPRRATAISDVAAALEHIISSWSARARYVAKDEKHGSYLKPRDTED
jgi:Double-GTPase 1